MTAEGSGADALCAQVAATSLRRLRTSGSRSAVRVAAAVRTAARATVVVLAPQYAAIGPTAANLIGRLAGQHPFVGCG